MGVGLQTVTELHSSYRVTQ